MQEATLREHDNERISIGKSLVAAAQFVSDRHVEDSGGNATHVEPCDKPGTWGDPVGEKSYLIRYGVMSHVGRFPAHPSCDRSLERGQLVVIQTDRGVELGEVLIATDGMAAPPGNSPAAAPALADDEDLMRFVSPGSPHVMRAAGPDDLSRSRSALAARSSHFSLCQRILDEGNWPWELVDVEPLLDGRATVLHYLGPHQIDVAPLRARFRVECAIDVVLEPVGEDVGPEFSEADPQVDDAGGCGSCGCGDGGGCGRTDGPVAEPHHHGHGAETAVTACAPSSHSGCASCGIGRIVADRRKATT
jgi:PSP1 C-terminal conserved region